MIRITLFLFAVSTTLAAAAFAQQPSGDAAAAKPIDPVAQALLDNNPTTQDDLIRTIGLLVDIKEPAAAKPLLAKLEAAATDDVALAALERKLGRAQLARFAEMPALQPE